EFVIDRLDGLRGIPPNIERLIFADGFQATIDLHITLKDIVIIKILGIEIASTEEIVAFGDSTITGENKICSGDKLKHQFGGLADFGMGGERVITRCDF